jgi:crotonobetainyl-CoA:carnitine CoA-transferase CaiB-like acyl-CoA transferase
MVDQGLRGSAHPVGDPGFLGSLYGEPVPDRPDRPWNRHAVNNALGRNKLSCTIDNRRPEGRELLMRLAECSDVFIENFRARCLARIGLHTREPQARNPRLIFVRHATDRDDGRLVGRHRLRGAVDGLAGMLWLGSPDSELVTTPGTTYMDAASAPATSFATLAALRYREETRRGQLVEVDQSENILRSPGGRLRRLPTRDRRPTVGQPEPLARPAGAVPMPRRRGMARHLRRGRCVVARPGRSDGSARSRPRPSITSPTR